MASRGEFGRSLEDVVVLTSLLLFDDAHIIRVTVDGEDQNKIDILNKSLSNSKYTDGRNRQFRVDALLTYWLYILSF